MSRVKVTEVQAKDATGVQILDSGGTVQTKLGSGLMINKTTLGDVTISSDEGAIMIGAMTITGTVTLGGVLVVI